MMLFQNLMMDMMTITIMCFLLMKVVSRRGLIRNS